MSFSSRVRKPEGGSPRRMRMTFSKSNGTKGAKDLDPRLVEKFSIIQFNWLRSGKYYNEKQKQELIKAYESLTGKKYEEELQTKEKG